jgi:hypothetical protein
LPKSVHPSAKAAIAEITNAESAAHARKAITAFAADFGAKRASPRSGAGRWCGDKC